MFSHYNIVFLFVFLVFQYHEIILFDMVITGMHFLFYSTFMDLLLEGCTIYIGQDQHSRMLAFLFSQLVLI